MSHGERVGVNIWGRDGHHSLSCVSQEIAGVYDKTGHCRVHPTVNNGHHHPSVLVSGLAPARFGCECEPDDSHSRRAIQTAIPRVTKLLS